MKVQSQMSMMFHLDKCIGCHTCSIACKNMWTSRKGTEYMWWNNVETKPGTGYPFKWEDQKHYKGGWLYEKGKLKLNLGNRIKILSTIFHNPSMPQLNNYYEPWTYEYNKLFDCNTSDVQPSARTISLISGKPIDVKYGPNWDDDLAGSELYAKNDLNLEGLSASEKEELNQLERLVFFYLPRICNHCVNASCVAACPSGAIYKRGEDGIVLVNQQKCRGWRMCISGCPYKKVYFNWRTGKSEKCILCYPKLESGQVPNCFHTCVGRIRYLGLMLYDGEEIEKYVKIPDDQLVQSQRNMILDPTDNNIVELALEQGLSESVLDYARRSPIPKFVKKWEIALPLHAEYRTLPMLFYVPPLLPVIGTVKDNIYNLNTETDDLEPLLFKLEESRIPIKYMANLFSAKNEEIVKTVYKKLITVRSYMRAKQLGKKQSDLTLDMLTKMKLSTKDAEEIYRLTSLPTYEERFVIPPMQLEMQIEQRFDPLKFRNTTGFGFFEDLPIE